MRMVPVNSSNLAAVGYDESTREMAIQFKSGAMHTYVGVDPQTHSGLMAAPSHGRFFNERVKDVHTSKRMGGPLLPQQDEPGADEAERYPRASRDTAPRSLDEAVAKFRGDG